MAVRYLADLETANIDLQGNELKNPVIHPLSSSNKPALPVEGQVFFNTTSKLLELWNGTTWLEIPNTLSNQVNFPSYGAGAYQGTGNYFITVDASGNLIENTSITPLSNGAIINGALNIIDVSSGESILYGHSGVIAQQNLDSTFSFADGSLTIDSITSELKFLNQEVHFGFVNQNYLPVKASVGYTTSSVYIDPSSSYVSINNTNPTAPFDVLGSVRFRSYGTGSLTSIVGESTFPAFDIAGNIVESQLITTNGSDVTIGQTATSFIKINDSGGTVFGYGNSQLINGGALVWRDGATERFRITAGGNVGIGTSSPAAKLDIVGTTQTDNLILSNLTTGAESTILSKDINGNVLNSDILKIGAAPDGGGAIGINTDPDWPLHVKGGVFNMALIESTSTVSRLLFKTNTSTIFPLIEVIGDDMLLDAAKVEINNLKLSTLPSGNENRILGVDINNEIVLSDGIRITPNLSGLPTLDLRNVDTYVTNTLAGFDGTKIVNNPHIQIAQGGGFTNVGIGGTPQFPLHIFGDTRNNAMFVEGQNNETRLSVGDLSGGNIYMASRLGVMKLFSNSTIQLWAGGTNRASVNPNGTLRLSVYGLGNNIGSEATFPVFDSSGLIRESRFITVNGSTVSITDLDLTSDNVNALLAKTPSYADNASAIAGGLAVGDTYYNNLLNTYTRVI